MAGPVLDLGLQGGRWRLYRDPPRPPPVGVAVEGNGGDALSTCMNFLSLHNVIIYKLINFIVVHAHHLGIQ
jgi:hypothetical protein